MGIDIHSVVQVYDPIKGWCSVAVGEFSDRNSYIFTLLAGVCSKKGYPAPLSIPRGLPLDFGPIQNYEGNACIPRDPTYIPRGDPDDGEWIEDIYFIGDHSYSFFTLNELKYSKDNGILDSLRNILQNYGDKYNCLATNVRFVFGFS